ncbi:MAG: efflux RND transporter periplasmic adaptor subunit [Caulobacteraceae bacterium]
MASPRRFRWGFLLLGLLLIALIVWLALGHRRPARPPMGPVPVSVAKVTTGDVPTSVTELGAVQAWFGVLINPQVNGRVTYVAKEGDFVPKGALLVSIDCAPYQATLTEAKGALARDQAVLQGAKTNLARYETLLAQNSIARQTEQDQAATVKQDEGVVLNDQGAVAAANVNVGWCQIRSPIPGRVGVRLVDPGNIVSTSLTTGIVSVNQVEPIAVTFTVPEGDFQRLVGFSDGFTKPLPAEALSEETGAPLGQGELMVADNHVDQSTGTVEMKARFANAGRQLWPGQFVNVKLTLQTLHNALTVPTAAVNQGPNGAFVYVVEAGNKVRVQPVKVLDAEGTISVLAGAVAPGDLVVTDGQMSLKPGSEVTYRAPAGGKPAA